MQAMEIIVKQKRGGGEMLNGECGAVNVKG